jgi:hypothetical protein
LTLVDPGCRWSSTSGLGNSVGAVAAASLLVAAHATSQRSVAHHPKGHPRGSSRPKCCARPGALIMRAPREARRVITSTIAALLYLGQESGHPISERPEFHPERWTDLLWRHKTYLCAPGHAVPFENGCRILWLKEPATVRDGVVGAYPGVQRLVIRSCDHLPMRADSSYRRVTAASARNAGQPPRHSDRRSSTAATGWPPPNRRTPGRDRSTAASAAAHEGRAGRPSQQSIRA